MRYVLNGALKEYMNKRIKQETIDPDDSYN